MCLLHRKGAVSWRRRRRALLLAAQLALALALALAWQLYLRCWVVGEAVGRVRGGTATAARQRALVTTQRECSPRRARLCRGRRHRNGKSCGWGHSLQRHQLVLVVLAARACQRTLWLLGELLEEGGQHGS
jgi:hypothetical protein